MGQHSIQLQKGQHKQQITELMHEKLNMHIDHEHLEIALTTHTQIKKMKKDAQANKVHLT